MGLRLIMTMRRRLAMGLGNDFGLAHMIEVGLSDETRMGQRTRTRDVHGDGLAIGIGIWVHNYILSNFFMFPKEPRMSGL